MLELCTKAMSYLVELMMLPAEKRAVSLSRARLFQSKILAAKRAIMERYWRKISAILSGTGWNWRQSSNAERYLIHSFQDVIQDFSHLLTRFS